MTEPTVSNRGKVQADAKPEPKKPGASIQFRLAREVEITVRGPLVIGGSGEPSGSTVSSTHELHAPFPW